MAARFPRILVIAVLGAAVLGGTVATGAGADNAGRLGAWGEYGKGPGQLALPDIFGVEPSGSVYVGDQPEEFASQRIQKFSATGALEGSVTIPTGNEEVFQGIAVDAKRGRFYVLRDHEGSDPVTGKALAEEILVFSTAPDASGDLVAPSAGSVPATLLLPSGAESIDNPLEIAVDPGNGELEILGQDQDGRLVLARIDPEGGGSVGPRYTETATPPLVPASQAEAIALAPDGTTYLVYARELGSVSVFTLPRGLAGGLTRLDGLSAALSASPEVSITGTDEGFQGNGPQIALSEDGETLFVKQALKAASGVEPGIYQISGFPLFDEGAEVSHLYGGAKVPADCAIGSQKAALASVGDRLAVLDTGSRELGLPAYGNRVLTFGPGGSGCPAPTAAATLRTTEGEVSSVPPGTSVTLDGTSSELGEWGQKFTAATWIVEGPDGRFEETVPNRLTLEHAFQQPGEYTVRLAVTLTLNGRAPGGEPSVYGAPPVFLEVASGGTVVRPTVTGLVPASGPAAGGNTVTISGKNLAGASAVEFGGTAATDVEALGPGTLTATAPPGDPGGAVDVSVTTKAGTSARTAADLYTYEGGPTGPIVTAISPASGPAAGGNLVTITGSELDGATGVRFGSVPATEAIAVDSGTVTARVPPGAPGTVVDVTVATAAGPTALTAGDRYKYEVLTRELGVVKVGSGSGTVASTRVGISCGASCSAAFPQATTVVLLASPAPGSTFAGWGGACAGQGVCVVGMTTAKSVTAGFDAPAHSPAGSDALSPKSAPKAPSRAPKCKQHSRTKKAKARCAKRKAGHGKKRRRARHAKRKHGGDRHPRGD